VVIEEVFFDEELNLILDSFVHREILMQHLKRLFVKHMEKEMVTIK
jgi:hypothetical protein